MDIELGQEVKHRITGFKGIVVASCRWLSGCVRVTVQPQGVTKEGKPMEGSTFDDGELEFVGEGLNKPRKRTIGGPMPEPTRYRDPK